MENFTHTPSVTLQIKHPLSTGIRCRASWEEIDGRNITEAITYQTVTKGFYHWKKKHTDYLEG